MTGNPRRSRAGAAQTLTDEFNSTLRQTVTERPLICSVSGDWAHISFTKDKPVKLDAGHWLFIGLDLYLGEMDEKRGQYRNHIFNAIFTFLDSPDRKTGPVLAYHLHRMDLTGAGPNLVPHFHARRTDRERKHIYVGRCCIEDLLEYLIREEDVSIVRQFHADGTPLTDEELITRASNRLHDSRRMFHDTFKTWHAMTPLSELPERAQRLLGEVGP